LDHFIEVVAGQSEAVVDARDGAATLEATIRIEEAVAKFGWHGLDG